MNIVINSELSKKYGLIEAILLHNFYFWITLNTRQNKFCNDGKFWTYGSVADFVNRYPGLTPNKIRGALTKLLKLGLIIKGNFNRNKYNHTTWYAFKDDNVFNEINSLINHKKGNKRGEQNPIPSCEDLTCPEPVLQESVTNEAPQMDPNLEENATNEEDRITFEDVLASIGLSGVERREEGEEIALQPVSKPSEPDDTATISDGKNNGNNKSICENNKSLYKINRNSNINISLQSDKKNSFPEPREIKTDEQRQKLKEMLTSRGISKFQLNKIVANYRYVYLLDKIEQYDFISRYNPIEMKNPARYMYMSIIDNWQSDNYLRMLKCKEKRENEEKSKQVAERTEKLKKDYELYLDNECKNEYLTLSDEEKEQIDIEIKRGLDNSPFIRSNELVYIATLETRRVLFVMDRVKGRAMGFDEFVKKR